MLLNPRYRDAGPAGLRGEGGAEAAAAGAADDAPEEQRPPPHSRAPPPPPPPPPPGALAPPPLPDAPVDELDEQAGLGGPGWWYWQAYRTWVPYAAPASAAIERSYAHDRADVEVGGRTVRFRAELGGAGRAVQFATERPGHSRRVQRLAVPSEGDAEATLRHMSFARLARQADSDGHAPRLSADELSAGELDARRSLDSMRRTIREQLGADGWVLGWEAAPPAEGA